MPQRNANDILYEILIVVVTDIIVKCFPFTITPCIFMLILWDGIYVLTIIIHVTLFLSPVARI